MTIIKTEATLPKHQAKHQKRANTGNQREANHDQKLRQHCQNIKQNTKSVNIDYYVQDNSIFSFNTSPNLPIALKEHSTLIK